MLPVTSDAVRLFLHVMAAAVWAGGQVVVAALLPALRRAGDGVPRLAARRFALVAWPAFAVLLATGVWNLVAVDVGDTSTEYQATLLAKLAAVLVAGVAAAAHTVAVARPAVAAWGAVGGLASVVAVLLGVLLHG